MSHLAPLIMILPLAGFLFVLVNGRSLSNKVVGLIGTSVVGLSFVASAI